MSEPNGISSIRFFGKMMASISHEIKNRMAIINEQAGLLEDLTRMAAQGRELDISRLERMAESTKKQIALTDGIIQNMNRFAHSADNFLQPVDMDELLSLSVALSKRLAEAKNVHLNFTKEDRGVTVETSPFLLMQLIWLCINNSLQSEDKEDSVIFDIEKTIHGANLWLTSNAVAQQGEKFLTEDVLELASILKAAIKVNPDEARVCLGLPKYNQPKTGQLSGTDA